MNKSYEKYAELRNKLGLSDADVSRKSKVSKSTISEWKNDSYNLKCENLSKIAHALDVPIGYFIVDRTAKDLPYVNENGEIVDPIEKRWTLSDKEIDLILTFRMMNIDGQDTVLTYAQDISGLEKYKKLTQSISIQKEA